MATPNGIPPAAPIAGPPTNPFGPGAPPPEPKTPLNVIVVGAGIAGLTAAASLRRAGHNVTIFEQSKLKSEVGAAIHVGPNASRTLEKLGYSEERLKGVECQGITLYKSNAELITDLAHENARKRWNSPWFLTHRVDLHNELKYLACNEDGEGKPAELKLASSVVAVDAENGFVELASGDLFKADLVVAADGIHSRIRELLFDPAKPTPTGDAAYRFIIPVSEITKDPLCLKLGEKDGRCRIIMAPEKRVVMYPCRNHTLLNFVCIHKAEHKEEAAEGWNSISPVEDVLDTYNDFAPEITNCLKKGTNIKCWQLLKRTPLDTWIKGRVVLVGDAAHPMLPHQGQGGGQAIEDGAAFWPLFGFSTKREHVPKVLELWQQVRKSRAEKVQWLSATQAAGKATLPPNLSQGYIYGHDVIEYAKQTRSSELIY